MQPWSLWPRALTKVERPLDGLVRYLSEQLKVSLFIADNDLSVRCKVVLTGLGKESMTLRDI